MFWQDPVGKFIDYLQQSRRFGEEIYVLSHNSHVYDVLYLLRKFLELSWAPQLIMDDTTIFSTVVENLHFLDSKFFANKLEEHALIIRPHM